MKYLIFLAFAIAASNGMFMQDVLKEEWKSYKVRFCDLTYDLVSKWVHRQILCISLLVRFFSRRHDKNNLFCENLGHISVVITGWRLFTERASQNKKLIKFNCSS